MAGFLRDGEEVARVIRGIREIERLRSSEDEVPGIGAAAHGPIPVTVKLTGPKVTTTTPPFSGGVSEYGYYPAQFYIPNQDSTSPSDDYVTVSDGSWDCLVKEPNGNDLVEDVLYAGKVIGTRNEKPLVEVVAVPEGSSETDPCTGVGWVAALVDTDCLLVSALSAGGACACAAGAEPVYLSSGDGETWSTGGGGGGGGGGGVGAACCPDDPVADTLPVAVSGGGSYTLTYIGNFTGSDVWSDQTSGHFLRLYCQAGGAWVMEFDAAPPSGESSFFTFVSADCNPLSLVFTNNTSGKTYTVTV